MKERRGEPHVHQDANHDHPLPHPEEAPRGVHRGVAQVPPERDPRGGRGPSAHGARPAHRRLHGLGRRPSDALPRRARARDRPGHRHDDPPPFLGRDPLHGGGLGMDRGGRRALRLEAVGRDPHPRLELASPRQRRHADGALHELLLRAHALDARHERDRGPRARDDSPIFHPGRRSRPARRATIPTRAACAGSRWRRRSAARAASTRPTTSRSSSPRRAARAPSS